MSEILTRVISVTPVGVAGSALKSEESGAPFVGRLVAYEVHYINAPATTVTKLYIKTAYTKKQVFTKTGNTDVDLVQVVEATNDIATGGAAAGWFAHPVAAGIFEVDVTLSDPTAKIIVVCYVESQ